MPSTAEIKKKLDVWFLIFCKTILVFFPHPCFQRRGENIKCIHGKREYICQPNLCSHPQVCLECEGWLLSVTALAHRACLGICSIPADFHSCKCLWTFTWCPPVLSVASQYSKCWPPQPVKYLLAVRRTQVIVPMSDICKRPNFSLCCPNHDV